MTERKKQRLNWVFRLKKIEKESDQKDFCSQILKLTHKFKFKKRKSRNKSKVVCQRRLLNHRSGLLKTPNIVIHCYYYTVDQEIP